MEVHFLVDKVHNSYILRGWSEHDEGVGNFPHSGVVVEDSKPVVQDLDKDSSLGVYRVPLYFLETLGLDWDDGGLNVEREVAGAAEFVYFGTY